MEDLLTTGLTKAQEERLYLLIEECSEVIHCATKILRHGYLSTNPHSPSDETNRDNFEREIGDMLYCYERLGQNRDISFSKVVSLIQKRAESKVQFLHHNER